jgi:hypothetical protein
MPVVGGEARERIPLTVAAYAVVANDQGELC